MPSPVGHALAGVATMLAADLSHASRSALPGRQSKFALIAGCAAVAMSPDLDLIWPPLHRGPSHSIGAAILVTIVATAVTAQVTRRTGRRDWRAAWRLGLLCGCAYATHLLLDWLGTDRVYAPYGIRLLWPFDSGWYVSDWDLFPGTARERFFTLESIVKNLRAIAQETAILAPVVAVLWIVRERLRRTYRSLAPTSAPDGQPPPFAEAAGTVGTWDRQGPRAAR